MTVPPRMTPTETMRPTGFETKACARGLDPLLLKLQPSILLVGEPDSDAEGAAKLVIDLGAAQLRRRRVEDIVDRQEELD